MAKCRLTKPQINKLADKIYDSKRIQEYMVEAYTFMEDDEDEGDVAARDYVMDEVAVVMEEMGVDSDSCDGKKIFEQIEESVWAGLT